MKFYIKTKIVCGGASRRLTLFGFYVLTRMATAITLQEILPSHPITPIHESVATLL
jgi:hypothetical protein